MSRWDSTKFKRLKAKWDKKLKDAGFRDIEDDKGNLIDHKTGPDFAALSSVKAGSEDSVRDYFYWASDMIMLGRFKTARDRKIWVLHSMGQSSREIAPKVGVDQSMVCRDIRRIRRYLRLQAPKKSSESKG